MSGSLKKMATHLTIDEVLVGEKAQFKANNINSVNFSNINYYYY